MRSYSYAEAAAMVNRYRQAEAIKPKVKGTYYDPKDVDHYTRKVFPRLVAAQVRYIKKQKLPPGFTLDDYEWKVGFYWMLKKHRRGEGLDFFLVPHLVHKNDPTNVRDYFDEKANPFYDRKSTVKIPPFPSSDTTKPGSSTAKNGESEDANFSFDHSTLFP